MHQIYGKRERDQPFGLVLYWILCVLTLCLVVSLNFLFFSSSLLNTFSFVKIYFVDVINKRYEKYFSIHIYKIIFCNRYDQRLLIYDSSYTGNNSLEPIFKWVKKYIRLLALLNWPELGIISLASLASRVFTLFIGFYFIAFATYTLYHQIYETASYILFHCFFSC